MKNFNGVYKPFNYAIKNESDTAVIDIDGYIGRDYWQEWMTGEPSPNTGEAFREQLRELSAGKIIININSPGGDLNEGLMIRDLLMAKKAKVVTNLMGFSASAATVIAQAGDERRMSETAFILVHRVMFGLLGFYNQNTFREMTKDADVIDQQLIKMYAKKTMLNDQEIGDLMDEGTGYGRWMGADEALESGFVDSVYDPADLEDDNTDHMEAEEIENMKRNVQQLAVQGLIHSTSNQLNSQEASEFGKLGIELFDRLVSQGEQFKKRIEKENQTNSGSGASARARKIETLKRKMG